MPRETAVVYKQKDKKNPLSMRYCFICKKSGHVSKFMPTRLKQCRKLLAFRKKKLMEYKDLVLPKNLSHEGYHIGCYDKFKVIKIDNKEEFIRCISINVKNRSKKNMSLKTVPNDAFPEDTPSTSNTHNSIQIEITVPQAIETPAIKSEVDDPLATYDIEIVDHDIKQEIEKKRSLQIPTMENSSTFTKEVPSYHATDISKAVILKSILTRKRPIKKDMCKDPSAFNSGMDFFRPLYGGNQVVVNQADLNPPAISSPPQTLPNLEPKNMNTTTLAVTGICLFCVKPERQIGTQTEFPTRSKDTLYRKILFYAKGLNDYDLLEKLKKIKTFSYHPLCRTEYRNKYEKLTRKNCDDQDWLVFKNLHAEAFEGLCAFIDDKIIDKHRTYFLCDLYERYKALLYEIQNSSTPFDFESYSPQNLQEKIVNRYYGIIDITTSKILKRKIVYKNEIKTNFSSAVVENEDSKFDKLAFELRGAIKSMKRDHSDESKGDSEIPEKLFRFVNSLIQGPDVRTMNSYENSVDIKFLCEDIVDRITKEDE